MLQADPGNLRSTDTVATANEGISVHTPGSGPGCLGPVSATVCICPFSNPDVRIPIFKRQTCVWWWWWWGGDMHLTPHGPYLLSLLSSGHAWSPSSLSFQLDIKSQIPHHMHGPSYVFSSQSDTLWLELDGSLRYHVRGPSPDTKTDILEEFAGQRSVHGYINTLFLCSLTWDNNWISLYDKCQY